MFRFKRISRRIIFYVVLLVMGMGIILGLILNLIATRNFDYLVGNYYIQREVERYSATLNGVFNKQLQNLDEVDVLFPEIGNSSYFTPRFKAYLNTKRKIYGYSYVLVERNSIYYCKGEKQKSAGIEQVLRSNLYRTEGHDTPYRSMLVKLKHDDRIRYWMFRKISDRRWLGLGQDWTDVEQILTSQTILANSLTDSEVTTSHFLVDREGVVVLDAGSEIATNSIYMRYQSETFSLRNLQKIKSIMIKRSDNKKHYVCIYPLEHSKLFENGLFFGLELNRRVILSIIGKNGLIIAIIGGGFILLLLIGSVSILIKNLMRPLEKLKLAATRVSENDFDIIVPVEQEDEFGEVARSFLHMVSRIRDHQSYQDKEIKNRTTELKSALMYLEEKEEQIQQEMRFASSIQKGLMSHQDSWNNISLYSYVKQVEDIGGDFIDNISLPDRFLFYLSDVSGHGVPAALISILTKVIVLYSFQQNKDLKRIISETNERLNSIISEDSISYKNYLTLFVAQVFPDYSFQYLCAGHVPAIKYTSSTRGSSQLVTTSSMLGVFDSQMIVFKPENDKLEPGDKLIVFSDGFINATNSEDIHFGLQRMLFLVQEHGNKKAATLKTVLLDSWQEFMDGTEVQDDVSLLVVERKKK